MLDHPYTIWDIFTPLAPAPARCFDDFLRGKYPDNPATLCRWMRCIVTEQGLGYLVSNSDDHYYEGYPEVPDLHSFTKDNVGAFFNSWMMC
ncbi:hypothetical protein ACRALDRAFT_1062608, partial [Sodiomyces alcalophilus JCM 7366]|uniref:uncharacterized protein n=1 Tax=Sodiomyces alcalophilus JCM 7366 TaxID=591952 RepID=UPI0039B42E02